MQTRTRPMLLALVATLATAPVAVASEPSTGEVRQYWTESRMQAATPVQLPTIPGPPPALLAGPGAEASSVDRSLVANPEQAPVRSHGKVFFTIPGGDQPGDFVCSGTLVESNSLSVVWTAGHCTFDGQFDGGFATNWMFVPAYEDGAAPYGEWPAVDLQTTPEWKGGSLDADFGAAVLARNPDGRGLETIIGARPIAFNQPPNQNYETFGYPASFDLLSPGSLEFDGQREYVCRSPLFGRDTGSPPPMSIECDMTGGSSGGGWVGSEGAVLSASSYKYQTEPNLLYGSYQGDSAQALYQSASGPPRLCDGEKATHIGTTGADTMTGTAGRDVFVGLGGDDVIGGGGGNDLVCGGGANDRLNGGGGDDLLRGQGGDDALAGVKGRGDECEGGPGTDSASGCEVRRGIP